jgi:predicted transposase/invertase (TIGR01784 family)
LPRTIIISVLAFLQFDCAEFYSEYEILEVKRHTRLTDRLLMIYFELTKLPELADTQDELKLWLSLFNAKTEEDLAKIESLGGSIMQQAIGAYRHVTATDEFKEIERLRSRARHNEAAARRHARQEGILDVARNLSKMNLPIEQIVTATGLTRAEVESLRDAD